MKDRQRRADSLRVLENVLTPEERRQRRAERRAARFGLLAPVNLHVGPGRVPCQVFLGHERATAIEKYNRSILKVVPAPEPQARLHKQQIRVFH